ncbi:MAG: hypothetical protein LBG60_15020 [Bifidobacteriaceae bacterium]|jgi:hypothetical protein|nr:hypothetical protein [Bifidobacteriaceae bacterium]
MAKFKNTLPIGDVEVPLLGRIIKAGETFDVQPEDAGRFACFEPVDKAAKDAVAAGLGDAGQPGGEPVTGPDDANTDGEADK